MARASVGEFDDFIETFSEDIVVFAHTHRACIKTFKGRNGKIIYVNTGCWLGFEKEVRINTV